MPWRVGWREEKTADMEKSAAFIHNKVPPGQ
jgi:hypothetical protein